MVVEDRLQESKGRLYFCLGIAIKSGHTYKLLEESPPPYRHPQVILANAVANA